MTTTHVGLLVNGKFIHLTTAGVEVLNEPPRTPYLGLVVYADDELVERLVVAEQLQMHVSLWGLVCKALRLPLGRHTICTDIVDIAVGLKPQHRTPEELWKALQNEPFAL